jgi:glutaredoxin
MITRIPPEDLAPEDFVEWAVGDKETPVVVFSLTWCSYCMAVKNLLTRLGISYAVYDLDTPQYSAAYKVIRRTLADRALSTTLPEVFIGAELVGGYSETSAALSNGTLKQLLEQHGVSSNLT